MLDWSRRWRPPSSPAISAADVASPDVMIEVSDIYLLPRFGRKVVLRRNSLATFWSKRWAITLHQCNPIALLLGM